MLLFGLFLAILGAALLPVAVSNLRDAYRLESPVATLTAPAEILKLHSSTGRSGTYYYIDYTYKVGALEVRVRPAEISRDNWQHLKAENPPITVRYLIADPTISEPVLPGQEGFAVTHDWIFACCSIFLIVLGYWGALFSKRGERTEKHRPRPGESGRGN